MNAGCTTSFVRARVAGVFAAAVTMLILAAPAPAGAVVLYDQYDNQGANGITSQDFEAANDAFDNQGADDFVVPDGEDWDITGVDADGVYFNGPGPAASVNVSFYENGAGGLLPGSLLANRPASAFTGSGGDFVVTLATPVRLEPGTHWVSVQARQDFSPAGQWGWTERTVTSNGASAWQNPGGGFSAACTAWGRRVADCGIGTQPDLVFRLNGTVVPRHTLTVGRAGSGAGAVTSNPAGIGCGADCSESYAEGTAVTLTATPNDDSTFTGWSGSGCSGTGTCNVTMDAAKSVTATFTQPTLTVGKAGTGSGTVTSNPAGIDCGSDCSERYGQGTAVTLTATPGPGSTFAGFTGACTALACNLILNADKGVTATFNLEALPGPPPALETEITKQKVKVDQAKAKFKFTGSGGTGALGFECKLDKQPYEDCTSPAKYRDLDEGKHKFKVRTEDATGAVDSTPAKVKFQI